MDDLSIEPTKLIAVYFIATVIFLFAACFLVGGLLTIWKALRDGDFLVFGSFSARTAHAHEFQEKFYFSSRYKLERRLLIWGLVGILSSLFVALLIAAFY